MPRIHSKSPWLLSALLAAVLAACSQPLPHHPRPMTESAERASMSADFAVAAKDISVMRLQSVRAEERLGTRWGDEVQSNVRRVDLRRVSQEPLAQNVLHYSSKDYRGRSVNSISLAAGRVELSVRGDGRRELPIFQRLCAAAAQHAGNRRFPQKRQCGGFVYFQQPGRFLRRSFRQRLGTQHGRDWHGGVRAL